MDRGQLDAPGESGRKRKSEKAYSTVRNCKCGFEVKSKKNTIVSVPGKLVLNGKFIIIQWKLSVHQNRTNK